MDAIGTLGEDLLLLSIQPDDGKVATVQRIDYGLMGSELVRLATDSGARPWSLPSTIAYCRGFQEAWFSCWRAISVNAVRASVSE